MSILKDHPVGTLGALNATYDITVEDADEFSVAISGTWVGAITFQVSNDNGTWYNFSIVDTSSTDKKQASPTTTGNGMFYHETSAFKQVRCKMTSYTSGTANIKYVTTRYGV